MPGGPGPLAFAYFAAVKFAGYSTYCKFAIEPWIRRHPETATAQPTAWKAGAVRTLIGIAVGVAYGGLFLWLASLVPKAGDSSVATAVFFALLIPIRVFEWKLLWRWMYKPSEARSADNGWVIAGGVATSFLLDAIGMAAAWALPGGFWVC
jgi:hypothetical protein